MSRSKSASTASDFYSRGHAVASLKIKTFTGKSSGSTRRGESSFMSARPCSRFAENKRRQTPFRVAAAFISLLPLPLPSLICIAILPFPPPSFVRSSIHPFVRPSDERGGIYITYFPLGLRYEKEYLALSLGTIFNRLSIVVEWRLAEVSN